MKNPFLFASLTMNYEIIIAFLMLIILLFILIKIKNVVMSKALIKNKLIKNKLINYNGQLIGNKPIHHSPFIIYHSALPLIKAQAAVYNSQLGNEKVSTIGGILIDKFKFKYGLGTCHGLKQKFVDNPSEFMGDRDHEIVNKKDDSIIGKLKAILFNDELDIALVRIDGRRKMGNSVSDNSIIGHPIAIYTPSVQDEKTLKIVLFSDFQGGKEIEGLVIQSNTPCVVDFTSDGRVQKTINNLIAISTDLINPKSLTVDGDSGVWVRTKDKNEVIGMVIGAKDDKTYVMKMDTILKACEKELNIKLTLLMNENDEKDAI